jgi:hypothetical protein
MNRILSALCQAFVIKDADVIFIGAIAKPLLWGFVFALIYFLSFWVYYRRAKKRSLFELGLMAVGFSIPIIMLAFVAGYLTGISRSSVVGTVIPAALTFIAALNVYVIGIRGSDTAADNRIAVGYSVFLFAFMFFYGVETGAYSREYDNEARLKALAQQEFRIREERKILKLPDDPPDWLWSLDSK